MYVGSWHYKGIDGIDINNQILLTGNGNGTFQVNPSLSGEGCFYSVSAADVNTKGDSKGYFELFAPTYRNVSVAESKSYHWKNNNGITFTNIASFNGSGSDYGKYIGYQHDFWPIVDELKRQKSSLGSMPRDYDNDGDIDFLELIVHGSEEGIHSTVLTYNYDTEKFSWDFDKMKNRMETDETARHNRDHIGSWIDLENNGLSDMIFTENSSSSTPRVYVFRQNENRDFINVSSYCGDTRFINESGKPPLNATPLDYDQDGDEDLIVGYGSTDPVTFLENKTGSKKSNWLIVSLVGDGTTANKSAIGAKVEVNAGGTTYNRYVYAGDGHQGPQKPFDLVFGLGSASIINEITVTWPNSSQSTTILINQSVNQKIVINQ